MIPEDSRFESDPDVVLGEVLGDEPGLPPGWEIGTPDPADRFDVARLTQLLRAHERHGRGWAASGVDDVMVEVSEHGLRMREKMTVQQGLITELEDGLAAAQKRAAEATRKMNAEARRADVAENEGRSLTESRDEAEQRAAEAVIRVAELEQELDVLRAELHAWQSTPARRHA